MSIRPERHPDMNLNDLEYSITYQICQSFDVDRSWEQLAGVIGYPTSHILTFELELRRPDGSPTRRLLWDWGSRGGTVRDLHGKLGMINRTQCMKLLEHIMNKEADEKKVRQNTKRDSVDSSLDTKDSNSLPSIGPDAATMSYNPSSLPIPVMKKNRQAAETPEDVNLNTHSNKANKNANKQFKNVFLPEQGAASVEMTQCQADGPPSAKGNMGAASSSTSSVRSFNRVKSVIDEYGSHTECMSQLSREEKEFAQALLNTPHYTYKELSQATGGFSANNKLGQGKFGMVFLGRVKNTRCAIKKLTQKNDTRDEESSKAHLASELKALCRYRHENIVTLYGYALDGDEVCLVYQYMPNKSLDDCLHSKSGQNLVLSWEQRLSILVGAACGLQFLHTVDQKPVIHGDIKSANILLDRHLEAKIGDLGLAQQATGGEVTGKLTHITQKNICTHDYTNMAYYAPEIMRGNGFSIKGDTYAFGVVILECLTGEEAYDKRREGSTEDKYLTMYVSNTVLEKPKLNKQEMFQDSRLSKPFPETMFEQIFDLAEKCEKDKKKDRPTMVEVYKELDKIESVYSGPEYNNIQELNLQNMPQRVQTPDTAKPYSIDEAARVSYDSQGSYSPGLKSANQAQAPDHAHQALVKPPQVRSETLASPIEALPKNMPTPEAFRLQLEIDKRNEEQSAHEYVNVSSKLVKQIKQVYVSDPKKLAEIEKADREFNAPQSTVTAGNVPHAMVIAGNVPHTMVTSGNVPHTMVTAGNVPHTMVTAGNVPHTMVTAGNVPHAMVTSGNVPHAMVTAGNVPNTMETDSNVPKSTITASNVPKSLVTADAVQRKLQEIEEFDKKNMEQIDTVSAHPVESVYASDPKKLAMLEEQDIVLKSAKAMESHHEYENVPTTVYSIETEAGPQETLEPGCNLDTEFADIAGKAQKGDSSMMDLFKKYDDMKLDEDYAYDGTEYDYGACGDNQMEGDDSETSTITDDVNNDSFHLSAVKDEDLYGHESWQEHPQQQFQPDLCIDKSLEEHQRKLEHYTKLVGDPGVGGDVSGHDYTQQSQGYGSEYGAHMSPTHGPVPPQRAREPQEGVDEN